MIPLAIPNLGKLEQEYVAQAIAQNYVGPGGPFVERFEELVVKASGRKWAVATVTGSAALHVAAYMFSMHGVIERVPRHAFPAYWNIVSLLGARVEFIDGGSCHDIQCYTNVGFGEALSLADKAPAIGERQDNGLLDCYSFAANKIATCGQGGAIVGDNQDLEWNARDVIHQGYGRPGRFNYRMANLNAALGCAQMERLDELKAAKKRIWQRYADASFPMIDRGPSRWMATMQCAMPEKLSEALLAQGIETRVEPSGGISLPCSTGLTEADQDRVIRCVESW